MCLITQCKYFCSSNSRPTKQQQWNLTSRTTLVWNLTFCSLLFIHPTHLRSTCIETRILLWESPSFKTKFLFRAPISRQGRTCNLTSRSLTTTCLMTRFSCWLCCRKKKKFGFFLQQALLRSRIFTSIYQNVTVFTTTEDADVVQNRNQQVEGMGGGGLAKEDISEEEER